MRVDEVMTSPVVTVAPDTPLKQVAALLSERDISGLPVVAGGVIVGVVSESDIVERERARLPEHRHLFRRREAERHERLANATTAGEAMSSPPVTVEPWMSVPAAAWVMAEHDVNRLPVVERNRLLGIVARGDLVRAFARSDADIAREIRDEVLPSLSVSPDDVALTVEQGMVFVSGELTSEADVECLPRAIRRVTGVVGVHSELRVPTAVPAQR